MCVPFSLLRLTPCFGVLYSYVSPCVYVCCYSILRIVYVKEINMTDFRYVERLIVVIENVVSNRGTLIFGRTTGGVGPLTLLWIKLSLMLQEKFK